MVLVKVQLSFIFQYTVAAKDCQAAEFRYVDSQRGGMLAPVDAIRMTRTSLRGHVADRRKFSAAIFASVAVFLITLVEFVLSAVDTIRMTRTGLSRQVPHTAETRPAMLAIVVRHFHFLSCFLFMTAAISIVGRRGASYIAKVVPSLF